MNYVRRLLRNDRVEKLVTDSRLLVFGLREVDLVLAMLASLNGLIYVGVSCLLVFGSLLGSVVLVV